MKRNQKEAGMDTMDKPKHKYWKVNRNDVGREVGNPDYVAWAAWKTEALEAENARLEREKAELVGIISQMKRAYHLVRNSAAGLTNYCEESASTIRCEKELEKGEAIYGNAIEALAKGGE